MTGQAIVVDRGSNFHWRRDHGKCYQWAVVLRPLGSRSTY